MSTIRVGSTEQYADGWEKIFGGKKKPAARKTAKKAAPKKARPARKSAKKKAAKKKR